MASISGAQTNMGVEIAATWNTPGAGGTGHPLVAESTPNFNVSQLTKRTIGSGAVWLADATIGNYIPTISLTGEVGFDNNWPVILAQFFGISGVPSEQTTDQD